MSNWKAPALYHEGMPATKTPHIQYMNLLTSVYNQLGSQSGSQIKLISYLLGTKGDGSFNISMKWICDKAGLSPSCYKRARKALIEKRWMTLEDGKMILHISEITKNDKAA